MGQVGLYSFMDTSGKPYVGRSVDLARRLMEHLSVDRINPGFKVNVKLISGLGDVVNDALPIAEQLAIDSCREETPGGLANKINAINKNRWKALQDLNFDIDQYLQSLWL